MQWLGMLSDHTHACRLALAGYVKRVIESYASAPDVSVLKLHVDEDQSDLPEGVTSHTQSVYLLLPEGMSSKELISGAHVKVCVVGGPPLLSQASLFPAASKLATSSRGAADD
jgi:hypothetical protein